MNLPVHLILEHGSSVFYLSGASPLFIKQDSASLNYQQWGLRFMPSVAYMYRFNSAWWLSLNVAEQWGWLSGYGDYSAARKEIYTSLRLTYKIAPFGFDDEVPVGDHVAYRR